jgi:hypothetical protein
MVKALAVGLGLVRVVSCARSSSPRRSRRVRSDTDPPFSSQEEESPPVICSRSAGAATAPESTTVLGWRRPGDPQLGHQ